MLKFKNAWNCKKCPGTAEQPNGCPMWWEMLMTHDVTNEQKIEKGCGFQMLPQLLSLSISETLHGTYAAYDMRNKVVKNMGKVFQALNEKFQLPVEIKEEIELLEVGKEDGISRNRTEG
jgi:hypothetical protein